MYKHFLVKLKKKKTCELVVRDTQQNAANNIQKLKIIKRISVFWLNDFFFRNELSLMVLTTKVSDCSSDEVLERIFSNSRFSSAFHSNE